MLLYKIRVCALHGRTKWYVLCFTEATEQSVICFRFLYMIFSRRIAPPGEKAPVYIIQEVPQ